jgi:hypothetical protein
MKAVTNIKQTTNNVMTNVLHTLKENFVQFSLFIATFFAPVVPMIVATILFILLDTVMGLWKCKAIGEERRSNGFKRGFIPKMLIYTLLIAIVFVADSILTNEAVKHYTQFDYVITKIVALILIFIEAWSIDENFKAIYGFSVIAMFKKFINYLKGLFRKFLDNEN